MEKTLFEQMGGTYRQEGDYLFPNLTAPEYAPIGIWGQRQKDYLRQHKESIYTNLLLTEKLDAHLVEVNQLAEEMFFRLVERMAQTERVNKEFKATDQIAWIGRMNNIRDRVTEIILSELIYT